MLDQHPDLTEDNFIHAYDQYADAIFRYCFYRVYNRDLARDMMQETFKRVWQKIAGGGQIDNLRAFLYTTAKHIIIDHSRKIKESSLDELAVAGFEPASTQPPMGEQFDAALVRDILNRLDEKYREVILLYYVEGYRTREISQIMHLSESAVYVRIHRGKKMLKKLLSYESRIK